MNYEEKYKEILKGIVNIINTSEKVDIAFVNICTYIDENCPELKESKDDRIIREIKQFLKHHNGWIKEWIDWLEKQGAKEVDPRRENLEKLIVADDIYQMSMNEAMVEEAKSKAMNALSELGIGKLLGLEKQGERKATWSEEDELRLEEVICMVEANGRWVRSDDAVKSVLGWLKTIKDRFGYEANCTTTKELKPSEEQTSDNKIKPRFRVDDVMRTHQEVDNNITDGLPVVVSIDDTYYHCTNELIAIKNQDDYEYPPMNRMKKPIDKVEPKFHEGEWLTENHPNDYARFVQILEIVEVQGKNRYRISRDLHNDEDIVECRFIEDNWHPFNIQDAKDGDLIYVSTEEKGIQAIFHEYKNETIFFHCYLCGDFGLGGYMPIGDVKLVYPLQKNHYKSFFAKMKEAGCKWDGQSKRMLRNDIGL